MGSRSLVDIDACTLQYVCAYLYVWRAKVKMKVPKEIGMKIYGACTWNGRSGVRNDSVIVSTGVQTL